MNWRRRPGKVRLSTFIWSAAVSLQNNVTSWRFGVLKQDTQVNRSPYFHCWLIAVQEDNLVLHIFWNDAFKHHKCTNFQHINLKLSQIHKFYHSINQKIRPTDRKKCFHCVFVNTMLSHEWNINKPFSKICQNIEIWIKIRIVTEIYRRQCIVQ